MPGLIPGASQGKGLGLDFLRHVERCSVLVHVLDCAAGPAGEPGRDPVADLDVIEAELAAYQAATGADLADRPRIVALNKIDVPAARDVAERAAGVLAARGLTVCPVSAASHEGLRELAFALGGVVAAARAAAPPPEPTRQVIRPAPAGGPEFEIVRAGENTFVVLGEKPRPLDPADRLRQRGSGRLPGRPAGPDRGGSRHSPRQAPTAGAEVVIGDGRRTPSCSTGTRTSPRALQHGLGPRGSDRRLTPMTLRRCLARRASALGGR